MSERMPTYFISHGGGPWPWIPQMRREFANLEQALARMPGELPGPPRAVLMISGHWETDEFSVMSAAHPPMVYDYHGFPPETYEVVYPAPGAPDLAARAAGLIDDAGFAAHLDPRQGFDHGTFVPMRIAWPDADMPVFQISIRKDYDPATHLALGRALAPLRDEGVLIVGSGLSYHNLGLFGPQAKAPSTAFDRWLTDALALPPEKREARLIDWDSAPHARTCHPREDHLVPLFVALGAGGDDPARRVYHDEDLFGGVIASSFRFG